MSQKYLRTLLIFNKTIGHFWCYFWVDVSENGGTTDRGYSSYEAIHTVGRNLNSCFYLSSNFFVSQQLSIANNCNY